MFRLHAALLLSLACLGSLASAQDLAGRIEGKTYVSPTGQFRVQIPVLPELGGDVTDTPNVVTFQDDFNVYVSIAAFQQDATQRWENSTRGTKDYLIYFFSNFVLSDFKQNFSGVQIESAKFVPGTLDGSLLTYLLVPGGTMFPERVQPLGGDAAPIAKRGNLLFVRNSFVYVVSIELAERVIEGKSYGKSTEEQDEILRRRLLEMIDKITFTAPAAAKK
jgi:hypothetical protein